MADSPPVDCSRNRRSCCELLQPSRDGLYQPRCDGAVHAASSLLLTSKSRSEAASPPFIPSGGHTGLIFSINRFWEYTRKCNFQIVIGPPRTAKLPLSAWRTQNQDVMEANLSGQLELLVIFCLFLLFFCNENQYN